MSSRIDKGAIYFIRPQKGFKSKQHKSKLVYDMSSVVGKDTITFNFSYFDSATIRPDSLILSSGDFRIAAPTEKIFIETKKSKWHYRYSVKIALAEIEKYFNPEKHACITISGSDKQIALTCRQGKWKKYASVNTRIFELIRLNR